MIVAITILNDVKQITLTPESEEEKYICKLFGEGKKEIEIKEGSFYTECKGNYIREFNDDESVMLILRNKKEE